MRKQSPKRWKFNPHDTVDRPIFHLFPIAVTGSVLNLFVAAPCPDQFFGPHTLIYDGYRGLLLGLKQPRREADHSRVSSSEVKNA